MLQNSLVLFFGELLFTQLQALHRLRSLSCFVEGAVLRTHSVKS